MADTDNKVVNMTLSREQYEAMERLAQRQGISMKEYIWQALELARLVVTAKTDGEKIIFKNGNSYKELTLAR